MCYKGKCLFCIPVEHGCLVFAVLSAIVTLLALLSCIAIGVLAVAGIIFASESPEINHAFDDAGIYDHHDRQSVMILGGMGISLVTLIASIPSLIAFIFSVLLCNGICKRRPGHVKAYFIYGVVITVLAVLASVFQMAVSYMAYPGLIGLAGCVIYGLILWMVFETYLKLSSGTIYKDHHVRLVESY